MIAPRAEDHTYKERLPAALIHDAAATGLGGGAYLGVFLGSWDGGA